MRIVKVSRDFYDLCIRNNVDAELMHNEAGRPCVLLLNLRYQGMRERFVVPFRSNISQSVPDDQFFHLPPNKNTKPNHSHGLHYIKIFPVTSEFVQKFRIDNDPFWKMLLEIVDNNEKEIVAACQDYLAKYEAGNGHPMTPDIDGILRVLHKKSK